MLPRLVAIACALSVLTGCDGAIEGGGPGGAGGSGGTGGSGGAAGASGTGGSGGGMPACGNAGWTTYGADAARTFATDGCIDGPLTMAWHYVPTAPSGRTTNGIHGIVATSDGVYLQWMATDPPYTGTTAMDRISLDGQRVWTYDSGTDTNLGHWPTIAGSAVLVNDDGLRWLDMATGSVAHSTGVDWWGQTATDGQRLYVVNRWYVDGPALFLAALEPAGGMQLWQQNHGGAYRASQDTLGAIALAGGQLYYAANYTGTVPMGIATGLFAFDPATGMQRWYKAVMPGSPISADADHVYVIEGSMLVARRATDGEIAWSAMGSSQQAPVLAAGNVIVGGFGGITAYDAQTGTQKWNAMSQASFGNGLAAALSSSTLVVTTYQGITVLDLATGAVKWSGTTSGAMNPIIVGHRLYVTTSDGVSAFDAQ